MSLVFNGNSTIENIVFNGHTVEHLIYNGVEVWSKGGIDYDNIPMTFQILTSGDIYFDNGGSGNVINNITLNYKINNGSEQSITVHSGTTSSNSPRISVSSGDIVTWTLFKNLSNTTGRYIHFKTSCQFNIYGNFSKSLTSGDGGGSYYCLGLFYGCTNLISAEHFILPATTLSASCYRQMFYGCTSLTTAPVLPATTLATSCYNEMFYNCTSLTYIKALFTTTPSTSYTSSWVRGVAASGTFIKNKNATWNVIGYNGIPEGWEYLPDAPGAGYVATFANGTTTDTGTYHFTIQTNYPIDNIIGAGTENTAHTNFNLAYNSRSTRKSELYIELDKTGINSIPSNATIYSVAWNIKYRSSNTTYITALSIQLASGTTLKGTARTARSTTTATVAAISGGSWTRSELDNIRLYMTATHNASSYNAFIELYGIEIDIAYYVE